MNTAALAEFRAITDCHLQDLNDASTAAELAARHQHDDELDQLRLAGEVLRRQLELAARRRQARQILAAWRRAYLAAHPRPLGSPDGALRGARADLGGVLTLTGGQP